MSIHYVRNAIASVMSMPSRDATCISEALYGEHVIVLEQHGSWVKVRQAHDGYTGFMDKNDLVSSVKMVQPHDFETTHWVEARSTLLFKEPDMKSPVVHRLSFASELSLTKSSTALFSLTSCGYYAWNAHCLPMNQPHSADPLTLAQTHFLGTPYRWGGRSTAGVDCSGLVQLLARSQGLSIPRDSGDQEQFLKTNVHNDDYAPMDLIYWPGHTGILLSADTLLHATAHTLNCLIEPLSAVIARAGKVSSAKRLFSLDG